MKKIFIIPALLGAMFLSSCEDFLDVNKSKDSAISTSVDQVLPVATFYASQICYDHAEYGVYMCQALTTGGKSSTGSYPYSQGWEFLGVNRHPMWRRHFYDLGANIQKMNELAEQNGQYNAILIGRTIMLMSTMMTTDAFGAMPRSEVYKSNSPKYDKQEDVYKWMHSEVEELLKLYDDPAWTQASTNLVINERMDRIYGGDMGKWKAFCKALQARLWLRKLPNWDNTPTTCNKIINMVDEVFASNWEEPRYVYPGGATESNCPWGPLKPIINSWESRANRLDQSIPTTFFLHGILGSIDGTFAIARRYALDPRAECMMEPRKDANGAQVAMRHLESNIGMDIDNVITDFPNLISPKNPYTSNTGYIPLITEEELLFIKAEAQYWAGDITGAYNTTVDATKKNMKRYGIDVETLEYAFELGKKDSLTEAEKSIYDKYYLDGAIQYNRFMEIKLPGAAKFDISDLMQQKYVAMYLLPEQWTDMRRYNYSSSENGISYNNVYVYDVKNVHNGKYTHKFADDGANYTLEYTLHRPFNLYEPYWYTADNYGVNATLSPNAWVNRLNADTETETKYNKEQLELNGYYTTNAAGEKILDYKILKKRLIWAEKHNGPAHSNDPQIAWM